MDTIDDTRRRAVQARRAYEHHVFGGCLECNPVTGDFCPEGELLDEALTEARRQSRAALQALFDEPPVSP